MIFKNKYLALTLLLSLVGCKFFVLEEEYQKKSSRILDKVNSMTLNASKTAIKNIFSDNQHSAKHLSKIDSKNTKDISPKQPESQKDILVSASSLPKKEEFSPTEHKDITIITADTSQSKSYSNSNIIIDNASITTSNSDAKNIITPKIDINTPAKTDLNLTTEHNNISSIDDNTTHTSENNINNYSHQHSETVKHQANENILLSGHNKTSLNALNGESHNIQYRYTYNSHHDPHPIISGSYFDSSITVEEDEFDKDDDEDSKLETRLDNQYKFNLNKTTNSVEQALKIAQQIKDDLDTIEFHRIKLSNHYGIRAEEHEKQTAKEELSKFSKDKLEADLKKLLCEIEKSLNAATILTTHNEYHYGGNLQSDLSAKTTLDTLKTEVSFLISKIQNSNNKDHQAYPTSYYNDYQSYQALRNPYSKLTLVKDLLTKTGIVAR
ncbi:hypothetical protein [Borrelia miyamotoi]|uniref:Fibronectin-binding protein n=1 Tax=Borrelia miyamotoi TaxID=47466 RepID=A0AAQ2WXI4_9SPIR|nr:hypothetical protein [Borrelia miyamotoi]AOW96256.1 hypothetical protein AXH25_05100 [Borrelia miyamotoi]QTL84053.1 hypothetical protein bmLB2001_001333 [Borrelia miyamotoi]WAZ85700.1 hypothetical protein O5400_05005 [Borrelia miyamotoi]WAZ91481.1 hypothetical protein O5398_04995 [Borrelia miyamotoi]WAZ92770.1 hypothetical protein O5402_05005 [Borrelia miyamotoi]